jgi:hypothetical protein
VTTAEPVRIVWLRRSNGAANRKAVFSARDAQLAANRILMQQNKYLIRPGAANRGAQTAFILFSTFLDLRPVSAALDVQTFINSRLEIRISKSKTPV